MKKIKVLIILLLLIMISSCNFSYANSSDNINIEYNQNMTTLYYTVWNGSDDVIFYDFDDGSWLMVDDINCEYIYSDINYKEYYFDDINVFKSFLGTELKNMTFKEDSKNLDTIEGDEYFNPFNYTQVNIELEKIPSKIKNILIKNEIQFAYKNIISQDTSLITHGLYYWDNDMIVYNKNDFSIEYAFIHEVGHSLDDLYNISANEILLECYNNKEIIFSDVDNNNYFYSEIKEYVAQAIHEYYNNTLDKNSKTYKELNNILNNL